MNISSNLLAIALLCPAGALFAQSVAQPFVIEGTLSGGRADSVKLSYTGAGDKHMETAAPVVNNRFILKGAVDGPATASVSFTGTGKAAPGGHVQSGKDYRFFFIDPGTMKITGNAGQSETLVLTGSKTQRESDMLDSLLAPAAREAKALSIAYKAATDADKKKALNAKMGQLADEKYRQTYTFMLQHPGSYVTAYYLNLYMPFYSPDSIKKVYQLFTAAQKNNRLGKSIGETLRGMEAGSPGQMAVDFSATDINGKPLRLSDFRGKYVILDFWASWCVPCRHSHPHLIEWYNKYKGKGLEIIGIACDDGREAAWKKAVDQDGIGIWHHVLAGVDQQKVMKHQPNPNDITAKYGVMALPTKLIIDPNGKILARDIGDGGRIGEALEKIFKN
ncbi:MAG TPA: TlpA disulfide reductase family protein [Chitinophaga sp.]|uniref:TlpA disulfide reductase family protein n=1 Tax=Chitinophaga sp. TaxID=1869181 RepID=UPI002DB7BF99|nr:TlpA disulfide reductase family protein [Chitinophaga sp.]HEU4551380.1 TlpA disulfide reductase family protein [Chitinophaga sp.]